MKRINLITNKTQFSQAQIYQALMLEIKFPHGAEKKARWRPPADPFKQP